MSRFTEVLSEAYNAKLEESNGKVNQTDRNALRSRLLQALTEDLDGVLTSDGAIVGFEHEYWGQLFLEVSLKMKDPDFDLDTAEQEYLEKQEKARAKHAAAQARAREREAKSAALKAAKEAKEAK